MGVMQALSIRENIRIARNLIRNEYRYGTFRTNITDRSQTFLVSLWDNVKAVTVYAPIVATTRLLGLTLSRTAGFETSTGAHIWPLTSDSPRYDQTNNHREDCLFQSMLAHLPKASEEFLKGLSNSPRYDHADPAFDSSVPWPVL